ncbi:MAG TPA: 30S ribosome-binding factor RbfA [Pseudomonadales bacterium]
MTGRDVRVADFIRDELSEIIRREMRDPRVGLVSVNDVRVSRDLSYADVYVSSLDAVSQTQKDELVEVLNHAAGFFRSELAKRHRMRTTPRIRVHYDEVMERGPRMDALIEQAMQADREQHRHEEDEDHG